MQKRFLQILILGALVASFTACGKEEATTEGPTETFVAEKTEAEEPAEETQEEPEEESEPVIEVVDGNYQPAKEYQDAYENGERIGGAYTVDSEAEEYSDWKEAYKAIIEDLDDLSFALIYVDDDDIPELAYSVNEGIYNCATFDGTYLNIGPGRGEKLLYIEKGNNVLMKDARVEASIFDDVLAIKDGYWISIASGIKAPADMWAEDSFDENGDPIISYWEISDYQLESQGDYDSLLNKYFDSDYATEVSKFYSASEIIEQIDAL